MSRAPNTRLVSECDAILRSVTRLRDYALRGGSMWSAEGYAAVNAMFDLTGVDALYDFAGDIADDADLPHEPTWQDRANALRQTAKLYDRRAA